MEPGTKLGPYEITEQLGAGGMGEVWLAEDSRLGREVAIKVLPAEFASDPERLARFEQEARAAAALNHPHIAAVHDVGVEDGTHFMVQEFLEGNTLREPLQNGALPLKQALRLATEIAEALAAAHAAGIVHRDLKPENIFVTKEGHAKVLDFGLAKLTEVAVAGSPGGATQSPTMMGTVAGQVMGTAGYMAPEQVEGSEEIDHRADLFAFGCVLYEIVGGKRAFTGPTVLDTLHAIARTDPQPVNEIKPGLPTELERILNKCRVRHCGDERTGHPRFDDDQRQSCGLGARGIGGDRTGGDRSDRRRNRRADADRCAGAPDDDLRHRAAGERPHGPDLPQVFGQVTWN